MIFIFILQTWLLGLFSIGVIGGAAYFFHHWQQRSWTWDPVRMQSVFSPTFGANEETVLFIAALLLGLIALAGRPVFRLVLSVFQSKNAGGKKDPWESPEPTSQQILRRPDGSELHVATYGPEDGVPVVATHGWGLDSREWNYLKRDVANRFRLVVWDEPGLGKSTRPKNRDYSLENLARDLEAVLATAGGKPAILLGHSIGGMITLTFCRLFPDALGRKVAGLVLTHTTPTNPVRTTTGAAVLTVIEKPVLVPLMLLTIFLSPLLRLMNWLSYWNGSLHLSTKLSSFGGTETWPQLDFATRFQPLASPAVLARGMLAMMRYDASEALPKISIPTLVVCGDRDGVTKPEASEWIRLSIPGAALVTLAPASHLGLVEHYQTYSRAVWEFAESTQDRPNV